MLHAWEITKTLIVTRGTLLAAILLQIEPLDRDTCSRQIGFATTSLGFLVTSKNDHVGFLSTSRIGSDVLLLLGRIESTAVRLTLRSTEFVFHFS